MGFTNTCDSLEKEVNFDFCQFSTCDNIDLETILQDFESFYYVRFQKYPQIIKKITEVENYSQRKYQASDVKTKTGTKSFTSLNLGKRSKERISSCIPAIAPVPESKSKEKQNGQKSPSKLNLSLDGQQIQCGFNNKQNRATTSIPDRKSPQKSLFDDDDDNFKTFRPINLTTFADDEWKDYAAIIRKDLCQCSPKIKWSDIIGLDEAKRLIKEAIVYPIRYPKLFKGILTPWKGLLLYGPPGTGKTLLAKAVATECKTAFFNISASTIVSKWRGESEKLVRVLFEMARLFAPSTIFLDELDSLMCQRNTSGNNCEHEGSRRMKTELLIQMDGLSRSNDLVFVLAASNLPWELDHAILRRLEKRILVNVPDEQARCLLLQYFLPPKFSSEMGFEFTSQLDVKSLSSKLQGYSGADIRLICKEAAMQRVRKIIDYLENTPSQGSSSLKLTSETISTKDVERAIEKTKPSAQQFYERYKAWQNEFGCI